MDCNPFTYDQSNEKYIISQFKDNDSFTMDDKIDLTATIIDNISLVSSSNYFCQEECHLTLINWIWNERKRLSEDNYQSELLRDLLFNIIIIFESIPLPLKDIQSFHLDKKLKILKKLLRKANLAIACRIDDLVNYWRRMIEMVQANTMTMMLQNKRERNDNEENESSLDSDETECFSLKGDKKKVHWKNNLIEVIEFCSDD